MAENGAVCPNCKQKPCAEDCALPGGRPQFVPTGPPTGASLLVKCVHDLAKGLANAERRIGALEDHIGKHLMDTDAHTPGVNLDNK